MKYIDIDSISELHAFNGYEKPLHPLVTVVDLHSISCENPRREQLSYRLNLYGITYKKFTGTLKYGRGSYDFSEGSLMFTAPYQVLSPDPNIHITEGWGLYIHPDLFNASPEGRSLTAYSFFGYATNEALHVSKAEESILVECVNNIRREIAQNVDKHSHELILRNISLLLGYANRFYERQFFTRKKVSSDLVQQFEKLLNDYFTSSMPAEHGLPDVKYFAERLHLSPNYLADLLTKYTGKPTQEHIHNRLIETAKSLLWSTEMPVSGIAYELGFQHPSYFTKLFKSKTGKTPRAFRTDRLN